MYFTYRLGTAVAIVEIILRIIIYKIIIYKAYLTRYIRRYNLPGTRVYRVSVIDGIFPDILLIILLRYPFSYLFNRIKYFILFFFSSAYLSY